MIKKNKLIIISIFFLLIICVGLFLNKNFIKDQSIILLGKLKFPMSRVVQLEKTFNYNLGIVDQQLLALNQQYEYLKKVNDASVNRINTLAQQYLELLKNNTKFLVKKGKKLSTSNKKNYRLTTQSYYLNSLGYSVTSKPTGYIASNDNLIFFADTFGNIIFFKREMLGENKIDIKYIDSNIKEIIIDPRFYTIASSIEKDGSRWMSIKGFIVINDYIYLSFTNTKSKDCYNTEILRAKLNLNKLNFETFFAYDECANAKIDTFHGLQGGGYMALVDDNRMLFSIGDFRKYTKPQNIKSLLGKIIEINLSDASYKVLSLGHRNPQGLYFDKINNLVYSTEHGPKGGDELNVQDYDNKIINNFGWPVSSYGNHYDGKKRANAPLHKSHTKYGFKEPIKYFEVSPGIAATTKLYTDKEYSKDGIDTIIVLTQGGTNKKMNKSLHFFDIDKKLVVDHDYYQINNRLRDIIHLEKNNYLLVGEEPSELIYLTVSELNQ